MRISKNHLDMLWRVALAGVFTSPPTRASYDTHEAFAWLESKGLARFEGRSIITLEGRALLDQLYDHDQLNNLRRMEQRRDARLLREKRG